MILILDDGGENGIERRRPIHRNTMNDLSARYQTDEDVPVDRKGSIQRRLHTESSDFEQPRTSQYRMSNLDPSSPKSGEDRSHGFSVTQRAQPPTNGDMNGSNSRRPSTTINYTAEPQTNSSSRAPTTLRQSIPIEIGGSSSNRRTCVLDINITLSLGGRSANQVTAISNDRISRGSPLATTITLDDVHTIDFDLEVPRNTVQIISDGTKRN